MHNFFLKILFGGGLFFGLGGMFTVLNIAHASSPQPMVTEWGKKILSADQAHLEYPRPGMVRDEWLNLNGLWSFVIKDANNNKGAILKTNILVPFPVESILSKVQRRIGDTDILRYERSFKLPTKWSKDRIMLHFEAVNWETSVFVNGKLVGSHKGGYDHFSFDITDFLNSSDEQNLVVEVLNAYDSNQARGKQSPFSFGIWYSMSSGIWQTVWLEPVPVIAIKSFRLTSDIASQTLLIDLQSTGDTNGVEVEATAFDENQAIAHRILPVGDLIKLDIPQAKLWSPERPFLYDLKLSLTRKGKKLDEISSYFGMRKISVGRGEDGLPRIMLNDKPVFQLGVLDQGYWPDGIYTAPSDEALKSDVMLVKQLGFNMCRKHVKIESERWYYWCDKLGVLVWQDMPSAGQAFRPTESSKMQFETELQLMVNQHFDHPSIVMWVAFNQGWGQYDTARIVQEIKSVDPSRLVVGASGWKDEGFGDVRSLHKYPGPAQPVVEHNRAVVCGESGGFKLPVDGHIWTRNGLHELPISAFIGWSASSSEQLRQNYLEYMAELARVRAGGLSGAVITQLTDVESEINGLVTYDRAVIKLMDKTNALSNILKELESKRN